MVKKLNVHIDIYTANKVIKGQHEAHGRRDDGEEEEEKLYHGGREPATAASLQLLSSNFGRFIGASSLTWRSSPRSPAAAVRLLR